MTLNASGPISLAGTTTGQSIEIENGGSGTTQISLNDTAVRTLAGVPSGVITMPTDFWGKSNYVYGSTWTYQGGLRISSWGSSYSAGAIAWSGSVYCVVGASGACATSPDGVTWTFRAGLNSAVGSLDMLCICWNGSQFLVGGASGTVATSTDGITWTSRRANLIATGYSTRTVESVVWTGSQYLIVGGSGRVATSPDGITWTYRSGLTSVSFNDFKSVVYGGGSYLAVAYNAGGKSTDGITWTSTGTPSVIGTTRTAWGVAYGAGVWVVVGENQTSGYSTDLVTWTSTNLNWGTGAAAFNVIWNGSEFIAVGDSGKVSISPDGITWTNITTLSATTYGAIGTRAVAWGNNKFVVAGYSGANSSGKVATSP